MHSPGDCRDEFSTDEEADAPRPEKRAAQVSCLPFSVDALMSDRRPLNATDTPDGKSSLPDERPHRPDVLSQQLVSVKSEPLEGGDRASWMSTPPRFPLSVNLQAGSAALYGLGCSYGRSPIFPAAHLAVYASQVGHSLFHLS
ncbi:hypothetical protein FQN60_010471 [Etheostoma spectabile]|uniref:Uncharacterized protein n=1 Tax=Etheostoma spectabile TaxID=54343 RepID=A0A5J5D917_9PERO|nr:hypothetical protein FQN60_010471 [Etheostoma spectabile]